MLSLSNITKNSNKNSNSWNIDFPQVEDMFYLDQLQGAADAHLPINDNESDQEEPIQAADRSWSPVVSGKLWTADTTMVRSVTLPHEVVYSPTAQPVVYQHISTMAFVDSFITVMSQESSPHQTSSSRN